MKTLQLCFCAVLIATGAGVTYGQARDPELTLWITAQQSNTVEDYRGYLDKYPDGQYATLAKRRILSLRQSGAAQSFQMYHHHNGTGTKFLTAGLAGWGGSDSAGRLSISSEGVSWIEPRKDAHNFKVSCSELVYEKVDKDSVAIQINRHREVLSSKEGIDEVLVTLKAGCN